MTRFTLLLQLAAIFQSAWAWRDCSEILVDHLAFDISAVDRIWTMSQSSSVNGQQIARFYAFNPCRKLNGTTGGDIGGCEDGTWCCQRITWNLNDTKTQRYVIDGPDDWESVYLKESEMGGLVLIQKGTSPLSTRYEFPCGHDERSVDIDVDGSYDHQGQVDQLTIRFKPSPGFCSHRPRHPAGMTGGQVFLVVILFGIIGYLGVGTMYNTIVLHRSGVEALPNIDFWRRVPSYIAAGAFWVKERIMNLTRGRSNGISLSGASSSNAGYTPMP